MKKYLCYFSLLLAALASFSACGKGWTSSSSGRAYEVLVVIDQEMWERPAGRALYNALDTDVPGLPQSERSFRIMYTSPQNYDSTLKLVRNIIIADVRDIYTQPKLKYAKDVYASPQVILTIQAPDEESFQTFVEQQSQTIVDFFTKAEMNRQIASLRDSHSDPISAAVQEQFGCDIWLPGELGASKKGEDFYWAGTNAASGDQNFVIYSYPYRDLNTFTKEYFVHKRDSVMQINIPGSKEGMYMTTDSLMTDVRAISVQGEYALEARGLWYIKGDMMGGPFVSHVRLDRQNQRIIVSEVFIYSPDKLKRNLVRQMEASLYTLKLPENLQKSVEIPLGIAKEDSITK